MTQQFKVYVDLEDHGERYEIELPELAMHGLITGSPYIDIGGTMKVSLMDTQ